MKTMKEIFAGREIMGYYNDGMIRFKPRKTATGAKVYSHLGRAVRTNKTTTKITEPGLYSIDTTIKYEIFGDMLIRVKDVDVGGASEITVSLIDPFDVNNRHDLEIEYGREVSIERLPELGLVKISVEYSKTLGNMLGAKHETRFFDTFVLGRNAAGEIVATELAQKRRINTAGRDFEDNPVLADDPGTYWTNRYDPTEDHEKEIKTLAQSALEYYRSNNMITK